MDFGSYLREVKSLAESLKKVVAPQRPMTDAQRSDALSKALSSAQTLDLATLTAALDAEARELAVQIEKSVHSRREVLLRLARDASMPHKRFEHYDRLGPFKVAYLPTGVRLEIGSEPAAEIAVTDGIRIFEEVQRRTQELEKQAFNREEFFRGLKAAVRLARDHGLERNGWFEVRALFGHVVLVRNLQFPDFLKKPTARNFHDYTTAQFVFDLARFGRQGWSCGDEILRSRTPTMREVSDRRVMMLPNLANPETQGEQIAALCIEKVVSGGSERSPSAAS